MTLILTTTQWTMPLVELPLDICLSILSLLDPLDIIAARKTCRYLSIATMGRQVWVSALIHVMDRNFIFQKSIHTDGMNAPQLERLATASFRFLHKLKAGGTPTVVNRPILNHQSSRLIDLLPGENDVFWVPEVYLIPGGRFLLTVIHFDFDWSGDPRNMVILFDLNPPKGGGYTEVARWKCDSGEISCLNQSDDGEEIRVLMVKVVFQGTRDEQGELLLTRICLKNYNTTGKSKIISARTLLPITIQDPDTMHYNRLIGDLLVCTYTTGGLVYVWNFVEDKFVKWVIPKHDYQEVFFDHDSQGTTLLMVSPAYVFGWKIPDVHIRKHSQSPVTVTNPALFVQKYKRKRAVDYFSQSSYQRTSDWYDTASNGIPKIFDVVERKGGNPSVGCHRHDMKDIVNPETSTVEKEVTYYSTTSIVLDHGPRLDMVISPYYVCNDKLLRMTHHRGHVCVVTGLLEIDPEEENPPASIMQLQLLPTHPIRPARNYVSTVSLDPMTGRLAYISETRFREIVVVDYV